MSGKVRSGKMLNAPMKVAVQEAPRIYLSFAVSAEHVSCCSARSEPNFAGFSCLANKRLRALGGTRCGPSGILWYETERQFRPTPPFEREGEVARWDKCDSVASPQVTMGGRPLHRTTPRLQPFFAFSSSDPMKQAGSRQDFAGSVGINGCRSIVDGSSSDGKAVGVQNRSELFMYVRSRSAGCLSSRHAVPGVHARDSFITNLDAQPTVMDYRIRGPDRARRRKVLAIKGRLLHPGDTCNMSIRTAARPIQW
jgi:hypothetical protein